MVDNIWCLVHLFDKLNVVRKLYYKEIKRKRNADEVRAIFDKNVRDILSLFESVAEKPELPYDVETRVEELKREFLTHKKNVEKMVRGLLERLRNLEVPDEDGDSDVMVVDIVNYAESVPLSPIMRRYESMECGLLSSTASSMDESVGEEGSGGSSSSFDSSSSSESSSPSDSASVILKESDEGESETRRRNSYDRSRDETQHISAAKPQRTVMYCNTYSGVHTNIPRNIPSRDDDEVENEDDEGENEDENEEDDEDENEDDEDENEDDDEIKKNNEKGMNEMNEHPPKPVSLRVSPCRIKKLGLKSGEVEYRVELGRRRLNNYLDADKTLFKKAISDISKQSHIKRKKDDEIDEASSSPNFKKNRFLRGAQLMGLSTSATGGDEDTRNELATVKTVKGNTPPSFSDHGNQFEETLRRDRESVISLVEDILNITEESVKRNNDFKEENEPNCNSKENERKNDSKEENKRNKKFKRKVFAVDCFSEETSSAAVKRTKQIELDSTSICETYPRILESKSDTQRDVPGFENEPSSLSIKSFQSPAVSSAIEPFSEDPEISTTYVENDSNLSENGECRTNYDIDGYELNNKTTDKPKLSKTTQFKNAILNETKEKVNELPSSNPIEKTQLVCNILLTDKKGFIDKAVHKTKKVDASLLLRRSEDLESSTGDDIELKNKVEEEKPDASKLSKTSYFDSYSQLNKFWELKNNSKLKKVKKSANAKPSKMGESDLRLKKSSESKNDYFLRRRKSSIYAKPNQTSHLENETSDSECDSQLLESLNLEYVEEKGRGILREKKQKRKSLPESRSFISDWEDGRECNVFKEKKLKRKAMIDACSSKEVNSNTKPAESDALNICETESPVILKNNSDTESNSTMKRTERKIQFEESETDKTIFLEKEDHFSNAYPSQTSDLEHNSQNKTSDKSSESNSHFQMSEEFENSFYIEKERVDQFENAKRDHISNAQSSEKQTKKTVSATASKLKKEWINKLAAENQNETAVNSDTEREESSKDKVETFVPATESGRNSGSETSEDKQCISKIFDNKRRLGPLISNRYNFNPPVVPRTKLLPKKSTPRYKDTTETSGQGRTITPKKNLAETKIPQKPYRTVSEFKGVDFFSLSPPKSPGSPNKGLTNKNFNSPTNIRHHLPINPSRNQINRPPRHQGPPLRHQEPPPRHQGSPSALHFQGYQPPIHPHPPFYPGYNREPLHFPPRFHPPSPETGTTTNPHLSDLDLIPVVDYCAPIVTTSFHQYSQITTFQTSIQTVSLSTDLQESPPPFSPQFNHRR